MAGSCIQQTEQTDLGPGAVMGCLIKHPQQILGALSLWLHLIFCSLIYEVMVQCPYGIGRGEV